MCYRMVWNFANIITKSISMEWPRLFFFLDKMFRFFERPKSKKKCVFLYFFLQKIKKLENFSKYQKTPRSFHRYCFSQLINEIWLKNLQNCDQLIFPRESNLATIFPSFHSNRIFKMWKCVIFVFRLLKWCFQPKFTSFSGLLMKIEFWTKHCLKH